VEVKEGTERQTFAKRLADELNAVLSIRARVELVDYGTLPRSEGKSKRVLDLRR